VNEYLPLILCGFAFFMALLSIGSILAVVILMPKSIQRLLMPAVADMDKSIRAMGLLEDQAERTVGEYEPVQHPSPFAGEFSLDADDEYYSSPGDLMADALLKDEIQEKLNEQAMDLASQWRVKENAA
jgi:hypothetical protein